MVLGQLFASGLKILTSKNILSKTVPETIGLYVNSGVVRCIRVSIECFPI